MMKAASTSASLGSRRAMAVKVGTSARTVRLSSASTKWQEEHQVFAIILPRAGSSAGDSPGL